MMKNFNLSLFKGAMALLVIVFLSAGSLTAQTPQFYNYNNGTVSNSFPLNIAAGKMIQTLVGPGEFNQPSGATAGNITKFYVYISSAYPLSSTYTSFNIMFSQTAITSLPTGSLYAGTFDTVYKRTSVTLAAAGSTWLMFTLDHPYAYNPTQSLVIQIEQCSSTQGTGFSLLHTNIAGFNRRTYSTGGCPFTYGGTSAYVANCGVDVAPAGFGLPELIYYKFENNPSSTTVTNYATTPVGTNNPSPVTGHTLGSGGLADTCLIGAAGTGANCVTPGWNWNVTGNWTIGLWVKDLAETSSGSPTYLFGDAGTGSFRCFYGGAALPNFMYFRGPFNATGYLVPCTMPATHYFHFVWNGTAIKIYDNGALIQTNTTTNVMPTGTGFKVGGYSTSSYALNLNGKMDEFRLYNRALDSAEIAGTWNTELGIVTNVTPVTIGIPESYTLSQNYPNPFNPVTKINYALPKSGFVTMKVYDMLGREVVNLVNEKKVAGNYSVDFNASSLTSGVYFYRLEVNGFVDTKKMMLIK